MTVVKKWIKDDSVLMSVKIISLITGQSILVQVLLTVKSEQQILSLLEPIHFQLKQGQIHQVVGKKRKLKFLLRYIGRNKCNYIY
mmetsp:Transcript_31411/g.71872  ORF Transcript_31411/g.71872 Transcript_31411/m.71872 type:complete len:85 (-) Transcript_31411:25-279(-)